MKRILFVVSGILLQVSIMILTGCTKKVEQPKEPTFCYSCLVRQEWKIEGMANGIKDEVKEFCGYTDSQISRMEKDSTYEEYEIYRLVWHSMKCTKK